MKERECKLSVNLVFLDLSSLATVSPSPLLIAIANVLKQDPASLVAIFLAVHDLLSKVEFDFFIKVFFSLQICRQPFSSILQICLVFLKDFFLIISGCCVVSKNVGKH